MIESFKELLKRALRYQPLENSRAPREFIASVDDGKSPYCPPQEGDLLNALITRYGCVNCLEIGFATGSTAIYILDALKSANGTLISIDTPMGDMNEIGKANLSKSGDWKAHRLILETSVTALPRLFNEGEKFDLIFVDGWKTFDHLAVEVYYLTRMLREKGFMVFDDAAMPSVHKIIAMLSRYYGYKEIDYPSCNQTKRLRLFQILTTRTLRRPYRALQKMVHETELAVTRDWNFFANF